MDKPFFSLAFIGALLIIIIELGSIQFIDLVLYIFGFGFYSLIGYSGIKIGLSSKKVLSVALILGVVKAAVGFGIYWKYIPWVFREEFFAASFLASCIIIAQVFAYIGIRLARMNLIKHFT